jgi:hypothetical protein
MAELPPRSSVWDVFPSRRPFASAERGWGIRGSGLAARVAKRCLGSVESQILPVLVAALRCPETIPCHELLQLVRCVGKCVSRSGVIQLVKEGIAPLVMERAAAWEPGRDPVPPHEWVFPWIPYDPESLRPAWAELASKIQGGLARWKASDPSPARVLHPWCLAFLPDEVVQPLVSKTVLPALARSVDASVDNVEWMSLLNVWCRPFRGSHLLVREGEEALARLVPSVMTCILSPKMAAAVCQGQFLALWLQEYRRRLASASGVGARVCLEAYLKVKNSLPEVLTVGPGKGPWELSRESMHSIDARNVSEQDLQARDDVRRWLSKFLRLLRAALRAEAAAPPISPDEAFLTVAATGRNPSISGMDASLRWSAERRQQRLSRKDSVAEAPRPLGGGKALMFQALSRAAASAVARAERQPVASSRLSVEEAAEALSTRQVLEYLAVSNGVALLPHPRGASWKGKPLYRLGNATVTMDGDLLLAENPRSKAMEPVSITELI